MKRTVFLILALLAVCGMLFAGGGRQSGSGKAVTFFYWDEEQKPGMDAVAAIYTKATGNRVESTITPWSQYWTKMQTALPSNTAPDVWWCNGAHTFEYFPAGWVQELQSYIDRDKVDMSKFPDSLKETYSYQGKAYGIPKDYDTIALYYNKAIFDARGVPYPTDNWTWADLRRAAERLTYDDIKGFCVEPFGQNLVYPWIISNNGPVMSPDRRVFTFNNPETIEALRELKRFVDDGLAPTMETVAETEGEALFMAGKLATFTTGCWVNLPFMEALGDKLGVARFPISKKPANVIYGLGICMSARSQNKDEAWNLIKVFTTLEGNEAQASVVLPAYAGAEVAWLKNFPSLNLRAFTDAASYAMRGPAATHGSSRQNALVEDYLERMFRGDIDIVAGVAAFDRECEAAAR